MIRSERSPEYVCSWIWPASAVTVTDSVAAPIASTISPAFSLSAALSTIPVVSDFLKPFASTVMV